tara:strand:- start:401 stop:1246 length:846 start_codon:yes stop_codon:yes gene_type:complete
MYGIEWGKGQVQCGFCGEAGHNITSCNHVVKVYESTEYNIKTHYYDGTPVHPDELRPWALLNNYLELSGDEQKAFVEMKKRRARQAKRKANKHVKRTQRCSFCRKEGHRRPSCKHVKKFKRDIYRANSKWKEKFLLVVNELGLGIGSLIEVPKQNLFWNAHEPDTSLCLVTGYKMESLNMFASHTQRDEYRTVPTLHVTECTTGEDLIINFDKLTPFVESGLVTGRWGNCPISVVSPSIWEPSEKWYSDDNKELEYVLKKVSVISEEFPSIDELIKRWKRT